MRAYASASIAFGLVHVPVKLYAAHESSSDISFNLLHKTCHSRLRQQQVCIKENEVVEKEAQIKGFEFEKDKYVTFTEEELAELDIDDDKAITIDSFVKLEQIDTIYFDSLQFLGPDKGADRSYKLLARAMAKAKRVAIGRYAARGKQHLVMLLSVDDKLVMRQLHYADEVRSLDDVPAADDVSTPTSELKLAVDLVRELEQPKFDASAYRDELKLRKRERINAKIDGRQIVAQPSEKKGADIIDLADALRASIHKKSKSARSSSSSSSSA